MKQTEQRTPKLVRCWGCGKRKPVNTRKDRFTGYCVECSAKLRAKVTEPK